MSKVTAEGNIDINANDGIKGWAAWSDGNGSEIALNQAGRGLVKGEGISFANNSGRILWNLNKSGSVLKGNLGAQNNGLLELKWNRKELFISARQQISRKCIRENRHSRNQWICMENDR